MTCITKNNRTQRCFPVTVTFLPHTVCSWKHVQKPMVQPQSWAASVSLLFVYMLLVCLRFYMNFLTVRTIRSSCSVLFVHSVTQLLSHFSCASRWPSSHRATGFYPGLTVLGVFLISLSEDRAKSFMIKGKCGTGGRDGEKAANKAFG